MQITWSSAPLLLIGLITGIIVARSFDGIGVITATHAVALGCSGALLRPWRTERGLWMLSTLLLILLGCLYLGSLIGQLGNLLHGAPQPDTAIAIDFAIGSVLFSTNIRFLYRVAKENLALG